MFQGSAVAIALDLKSKGPQVAGSSPRFRLTDMVTVKHSTRIVYGRFTLAIVR